MDVTTTHARADRRTSVRLDPAAWVSIRPIDACDGSALSDFYAALSDESSRRRFLSTSRPSQDVIARLARADGLVAVLRRAGADDGAIVGHALLAGEGNGVAEAAFAVRDDLQHRGIGGALVSATIARARRLGFDRLRAITEPANRSMRRLVIDAGCTVESDRLDAGVEELVLRLSDASPGAARAA